MNLPRNLIAVGWFRDLATANPVSYMIEAMRSLVITGWDVQALALGFLFTVLMIIVGLVGSARLLKTRMART
jgi:ABC-2 type transport system permease protein